MALHRNERGFTLLEMLIVLFIFSVITLVASSMLFRFYEQKVYEQAEEKLRMTFHYAQRLAVEEQRDIYVYTMNSREMSIRTDVGTELFRWQLPEGMTADIEMLGTANRILFRGNGNLAQIGNLTISTPYKRENYSVNLSKGRLRLSE